MTDAAIAQHAPDRPALRLRQAGSEDAALVADVLARAALRLAERGMPLWDSVEVGEPVIARDVERGLYYIAADHQGVVGVFRFQHTDSLFWREVPPGSSAFLHKVAVHPARQGQGAAQGLLACARDLARAQGRRWLRLDCVGGRPKLRAVYERFGFRHHSDLMLSGQVFHRFELELLP